MSHITCPAETVARDAQLVINKILAHRTAADEARIQNTITNKPFWRKHPYTREEAIAKLDFWEHGKLWGWRNMDYGSSMYLAQNLLLLAQHGDPVIIDEDAARLLWR